MIFNIKSSTSFNAFDKEMMDIFFCKPGFLLGRIDQICTAIYNKYSNIITLNQAEFLILLDNFGPLIQIDLARKAGVDKSTAGLIIDNLQYRGWVERNINEKNRRSVIVSLTPQCDVLLPTIRRHFFHMQRELEVSINRESLPRLIANLHRIGANPAASAPVWQAERGPESGILDGSLSFLTRRVLQLLHGQFNALTPGSNLTLRQFSLLYILMKRDFITQIYFARIFGVDPVTCGVIMKGLERNGLIAGQISENDKRAKVYNITKKGKTILSEVHSVADFSEKIVFQGISSKDYDEIVTCLYSIVESHSYLLRFPGLIGKL